MQFFSSYFHQDWADDDAEPNAVIDGYRLEAGPEQSERIASGMDVLLAGRSTDEQLTDVLFAELGCYYDPGADGIPARSWRCSMAERLRRQ